MWKPLIRSSVVGGLIVFLWIMISWTVMPMHRSLMSQFSDETNVAECIMENAPENGIYILPHRDFVPEKGGAPKLSKPFIFMSVKREGINFDNMLKPLVVCFIMQVIGAFFVTSLLLQAKKMKYWRRVFFVTFIGVIIGILGITPPWNWWGFPTSWILLEMFDLVIGWFLGGVVIARLSKV